MSNICPYCESNLEIGSIWGGKHPIKWYKKGGAFIENTLVFGGELISGEAKLDAYRCINCSKIIIDTESLKPY